MGQRLCSEVDAGDPLHEEMLTRDPMVTDAIKLSGTLQKQIPFVAKKLGVDGDRIMELLGRPSEGDSLEWGHTIDDDEKVELRDRLTELMTAIEEYIDPDSEEDIVELGLDVHPNDTLEVEFTDEVVLYVYHRSWSMRKLVDFCIEHDLELYVG